VQAVLLALVLTALVLLKSWQRSTEQGQLYLISGSR
jgi:hypothetical protein